MGTNYYMRTRSTTCKCCQRANEEDIIHIGKSSWGWTFSFMGYTKEWHVPRIESYKDWKMTLSNPDTYIMNEYDEEVSKEEFFEMVEDKQKEKGNRNHAEDYTENCFLDKDGYSFNTVWFR